MVFRKKNSQEGSVAISVIGALTVLAITGAYIFQNQQKVKDAVVHARVKMTNESATLSNMNAVAQFKALLNNGKVGSEYLPALFPQNYWLADWSQITKNPQIPSNNVQAQSGSNWLKINLVDTGDLSSNELASVLNGTKSMTMLKPQDGSIRILKANFVKSVNFDYVESVDVEVKTTKVDKDQTSTIVSQARIPVPVPQPSDLILELSPKGTNNWTTNLTTVGPGEYDIRVTASGVVYKTMIFINDESPLELSVFNPDTGEPTNHKATNVLAKNVIVGQTSYQFVGFTPDPTSCALAPADGQYTIRAVLYNARGEKSEAPNSTVEETFSVYSGLTAGKDLTDEEFKAACPKECPWYEGESYFGPVVEDAQDRKYGDYSRDHQMAMRNDQIKIKSVKFCENVKESAEHFYAANGRTVANWGELSTSNWENLTYVYYTVPQCKRKFLFMRGACGCFSDETMITMGDGKTQKKITELTAQDQVWNPMSKKAQSIVRMTQGPEAIPMIEIKIENKILRVTGHHPFPAKEGLIPAFALKEGDLVQSAHGSWVPVQSIQVLAAPAKAPMVWNLELKGSADPRDHYVLANGVVTGDLYLQTRLQKADNLRLAEGFAP